MIKTQINSDAERGKRKSCWLDGKALARVEATSEDSHYPIKSEFEEDGHGWRAVEVGEQTIRLVFDEPRLIQRIWLCFIEPDAERTQEFTLQWSTDQTATASLDPAAEMDSSKSRRVTWDDLVNVISNVQWMRQND